MNGKGIPFTSHSSFTLCPDTVDISDNVDTKEGFSLITASSSLIAKNKCLNQNQNKIKFVFFVRNFAT